MNPPTHESFGYGPFLVACVCERVYSSRPLQLTHVNSHLSFLSSQVCLICGDLSGNNRGPALGLQAYHCVRVERRAGEGVGGAIEGERKRECAVERMGKTCTYKAIASRREE